MVKTGDSIARGVSKGETVRANEVNRLARSDPFYLVLATLATDIQIQERLNELAAEGYSVVAMSDRWIVLEKAVK